MLFSGSSVLNFFIKIFNIYITVVLILSDTVSNFSYLVLYISSAVSPFVGVVLSRSAKKIFFL